MTTDAGTRQPLPKGTGPDVTTRTVQYIMSLPVFPRVAGDGIEEMRLAALASLGYIIQLRLGKLLSDKELKKEVGDVILARTASGEKKYGERLRAFNGRDALLDWLQEEADAIQYATQHIIEQEKE